MEAGLFCMRNRKLVMGLKRLSKTQKVIFFLIALYFTMGAFGDFYLRTCLAFGEESYKLTRRDKPFSIHFVDDKVGWIVGDNGLVLTTNDSGENWARVQVSGVTLNDICFVGQKGWIVGGSRLILHTADGGKSWIKQMGCAPQAILKTKNPMDGTCPGVKEPPKSLMKVFFLDKDRGFTVGADGTVLRTMNGGSSWEDESLDCMEILPEDLMMNGIISINLYDIFFLNDNSGWIVGDSGAILHSEDGGKEWSLKHVGLLPPLFSISFKNDKEGWAVGQNGFSLKTDDGGTNWKKVVIDKEKSLYKIRNRGNYGVIVGEQATIIKTIDGGKTWDKVQTDLVSPFPWLIGTWILPSNSTKALSIGKGIVIKTSMDSK